MLSRTMSQRCAAMAAVLLVVAACPFPLVGQQRPAKAPYLDPALPVERRADNVVSRITLEEKISQMMNVAPAISRLGIPEYDWTSTRRCSGPSSRDSSRRPRSTAP